MTTWVLLLQVGYTEQVRESRSVVSDSLRPHRLHSPWDSPGQDTGVGSLSLLQRIFPTQESNWGLLHCRRILYHLSPQGSPHDRFLNIEPDLWALDNPAWSLHILINLYLYLFCIRICICFIQFANNLLRIFMRGSCEVLWYSFLPFFLPPSLPPSSFCFCGVWHQSNADWKQT